MILFREIFTIEREIEPRLRFTIFSICVRQLTYEMCFIPALSPGLFEIAQTDREDL